jgi:Dehydrogenases with different specificities (related to short-chain alcohol dehydrogenases)
MDLEFSDKVVFVAGSTRGIGRAIVYSFLQEGANVVITGRQPEAVEECIKELKEKHEPRRILGLAGDLTSTEHIRYCLRETIARFGRLDVVVANIGSGQGRIDYDLDDQEWNDFFQVNLFSGVRLVREVVPYLKEKQGVAIFISSIAGIETLGAPVAYEAAKAAVVAAAKSLARRLGALNIRINTVAPGNILFPGSTWDRKLSENREEILTYIRNNVPVNRLGTPEEVAAAVLFLASAQAKFITGACLVIDGGQTRGF